MATAWIQKHDFSAEELGYLSKNEMVVAFDSFDWPAELAHGVAGDPNATCPPGFGINRGANVLHLCPYDNENMFFHLHYKSQVKFLGIVPISRNKSHYVESYPVQNAQKIISRFMDDDLTAILGIK